MKESEIIQGLREKNTAALYAAISHYAPTINKVVHSVMLSAEEKYYVDEIVNDVLTTLWFHMDSYDETKAPFLHWLISVSKYKAIDYKRKIANKQFEHELDETIYRAKNINEEDFDLFFQLIQTLGPKDKDIFVRRYLHEEKTEDIALELGMSHDNLYQRLSRGRKRLKDYLVNKFTTDN